MAARADGLPMQSPVTSAMPFDHEGGVTMIATETSITASGFDPEPDKPNDEQEEV